MRIPINTAADIVAFRRVRVLPQVPLALAQALRRRGLDIASFESIRDTDLPRDVLIRCSRLETGSGRLLQAPAASVCRCVCGVEAGIPAAWCASLPPNRPERRLHRQVVALADVVRSRWEQRLEALARWNTGRQG